MADVSPRDLEKVSRDPTLSHKDETYAKLSLQMRNDLLFH